MRHRIVGKKFNRSRPHYHALMDNLITSMLKHGSIKTTLPKAKEARPLIEKIITLGKKGTLHARRTAFKTVRDEEVLSLLFSDIAPRMKDRSGGYTRILKLGFRPSDAAPMARLELVDFAPTPKAKKTGPAESKAEASEEKEEAKG
jgi:large subunit ribosomal protein L17